ncbi:TPA: hypothetical protein HA259_08900 [Thermoplasmata archaeon]|nr:hypothetical protein [Thermoplasmata archaeon]
MHDWMSEVGESTMEKAYGIGPGDIRNKVELAEWLTHAASRLAGLVNRDAVDDIDDVHKRIVYGVRGELLELVKLRGVGRVRARALFDRKIRTLEDLRHTSFDRLRQMPNVGEAVARAIKSQLGQSEPGVDEDLVRGQSSLRDF